MTRNGDGSAGGRESGLNGPPAYRFGEFYLDLRRLGLTRGAEPLALEPKAFDVLKYLIERRDRLVSKDELLDAIWKDTFVTPNALTRAVAHLRKVLGDDAEHPTMIETIAKRGYRFIAPVTDPDDAPAAPNAVAIPRASPVRRSRVGWTVAAFAAAGALALVWWTARASSHDAPAPQIKISPITSSGDVIDGVISPDGRYLAYVRSEFGVQGLWIRQLAGADPIQLVPDAAVGYFGITFVPDGASIYYVIRGPEPLAAPGGMLFQIPALGGTPRRLGAIFDHRPAVSPDGRLLASLRASFNGSGQSALVVANADGSGLRALFSPKAPDFVAPGFFIGPSWSPTGQDLSFAIRDVGVQGARLATINLANGQVREFDRRFADATASLWMPDGSGIVFAAAESLTTLSSESGAQLWFQPLPSGPVRALTAGAVTYRNVSVSSDSTRLVSVGSVHRGSLWTVPLEGHGTPRKLPSLRQDGFAGVAWFGGDHIVFTSLDTGAWQIWTSRADGTERRQLTADGWNFSPVPTKDGRAIYFASTRGDRLGVWRMGHDGTNPQFIAPIGKPYGLALSPDEQTIFYSATSQGIDSTWRIPVAGGTPALVATGLTRPKVSPDGRMVAGVLQVTNDAPAVAVFSIDGEPITTFRGNFVLEGPGAVWWSRNNDAVYYTTAERANVWRQPLRGGAPVRVTDFSDGVVVTGDLSADYRTLIAYRGDLFRDAFMVTGFR